jgi:hypothetical protein
MPSLYNLPQAFGNANVEDINRFQQLPFYLTMNEVRVFPTWNIFDQLFGEKKWEPNQGTVMRGTTPQRSPVGRALFFPNLITQVPKKDIYQVSESTEEARLRVHNFESFQFNFNPSFTVFWRDYLKFADTDIASQIQRSNNQFIETNLLSNSPYVWFAGTGLTVAPTGDMNVTMDAAGSKTAAWLVANTQLYVKSNFNLRNAVRGCLSLQEDLAAPPFEGARNMPKDNEGLKGKYVIITSTEAWSCFPYDPDTELLKSIQLDLLFEDFHGLLFGTTTVKFHRYPIRFNIVDVKDGAGNVLWAAGFPIDPEIFNQTTQKWEPNPYYTDLLSAPYEIGWFLGADVCRTIKVGPPPREFSNTDMDAEKFYSLKWNGEVRLTDQVLITYDDNSIDLNHYGEQLKFISKATFGYLVGERRYGFPIIFRRQRPILISE